MNTLASRLNYLMNKIGVSQSELARYIGITQPSVHKILNGETRNPKNIVEIATALGVDVHWLKTGEGEPYSNSHSSILVSNEPDEKHTHRINRYDFQLSAGDGIINSDYPETISSIWLTPEGMMQIIGRYSEKGICIFKVPTDSMEPTISSKDLVFIDTNITYFAGDGIYAFRLNGKDYIKRLQQLPTGIIRALSDNKLYDPFDITEELFDTAEIVGKFIRVVPLNPKDL
ncbi:XRE family transcriptional regulator [Histophilus somni]|uniref:XRE family transcriptional regulator n=1 Tax=Histophilus somni TaxID=731 RepID=UPI0010AAB644|nr:helix-turn-helix transcriptional regulator [Histophilus somni]TJY48095.1 helix-turn-helix transcriptional regulator [Histophilus somni]